MAPEKSENQDFSEDQPQPKPLCTNCMKPVDPRSYYCPHCTEATGQLTQYLPFVNIPWQARTWGRMWRQIWPKEVSIPGRLFRLIMIIWNVPIILIGLLFREQKTEKQQPNDNSNPADEP